MMNKDVSINYDKVPRYEPVGWFHWPHDPELSFQFLRSLGSSQDNAGSISECFLAASRMDTDDIDSWYREWVKMGEVNYKRGNQYHANGYIFAAQNNWMRAGNYYRAAEFFLGADDPRKLEVFDKVEECSHLYLKYMNPAGEVVKVPYENGAHLAAYFIRSPYKLERQPTVICFGGLDEYKDEQLHKLPHHLLQRGMSVLLVDLPGQGATLRRQEIVNRHDTEVPVGKCVDYLSGRNDVDPDRIALYGSSLGGYYAARAASYEHRLKLVVTDGGAWDLYETYQHVKDDPTKRRTMDISKIVFGKSTAEEIVEKSKDFRLRGVIDTISCPYLIVFGEHDFLGLDTAEENYSYAREKGLKVEYKLFTAEETGASHCQVDNPTIGQEYICSWIAAKLNVNEELLTKQGFDAAY